MTEPRASVPAWLTALLAWSGHTAILAQDSVATPTWHVSTTGDSPRLSFVGSPLLELPASTMGVVAIHESGGILRFAGAGNHVTFGPEPRLGVRGDQTFALRMRIRTEAAGFSTALMCREGSVVHFSLVMGRHPGTIAFEAWHWSRDRAESSARIDDGQWHDILAAYDHSTQRLLLAVDGDVQADVATDDTFGGSSAPSLRLGENLDSGVTQPFVGELSDIACSNELPTFIARHRSEQRSLRVLTVGEAERAAIAWNDRLRERRTPDSSDREAVARETERTRALVQDALGLWPPPYSHSRPPAVGTPLANPALSESTNFSIFRPDLPLEPIVGERHDDSNWSVERIYWQSFRGYFASGWLYRPSGESAPRSRAAVLSPHGHWRHGAIEDVVQTRCIGLARLGYVVLAVDSVHFEDPRLGLSSLSVMTWNNLRGLELLRALPDVDPDRIGCTGASGGGQQTYYLTALDSGLAAAVPAVMACHFSEITAATSPHCHCNHTPFLAFAVDMPHMAAAFAPKPQLFLTVSGDWTQSFREFGYPEVRATYERLDALPMVGLRRWDKGHTYDREMRNAMYAFFERHLHGVTSPADDFESDPIDVLPIATMRGWDRDDVPRDLEAIRAEFTARLVRPEPSAREIEDPTTVATIRKRLGSLLHVAHSSDRAREPVPIGAAPIAATDATSPSAPAMRWRVPIENGMHMPVVVLGEHTERAGRVVVLLHPRGKAVARERHRATIDRLVARGAVVVLADLRYTGELDVGSNWRDLHGRFFGRDEGQVQVHDTLVLFEFVRRIAPKANLEVVADGWLGASVLLAAAISAPLERLVLTDLGHDWIHGDRRPRMARVLLHGDLPDAVFATSSKHVVIGAGSVGPLWDQVATAMGSRLHRETTALTVDAVTTLLGLDR